MYFALKNEHGFVLVEEPIDRDDDGETERICNQLEDLFTDSMFAISGNRNYSAVNFCIWMWCLGYDEDTITKYAERFCIAANKNWNLWEEHIERVLPYLPEWGEKGTTEAEVYTL